MNPYLEQYGVTCRPNDYKCIFSQARSTYMYRDLQQWYISTSQVHMPTHCRYNLYSKTRAHSFDIQSKTGSQIIVARVCVVRMCNVCICLCVHVVNS